MCIELEKPKNSKAGVAIHVKHNELRARIYMYLLT